MMTCNDCSSTDIQKGFLDNITEKVISRKFLAWLTATGLLAFGAGLDADNWIIVTSIYIGGQTVVDAVERLKK
jgi:uncharacterized membrane protein YidH (DUF202 family)